MSDDAARAMRCPSFVIMSPAKPGVVIQLDGHDAKRLAMTFPGFIAVSAQIQTCSRLLA
jgi:hypothetical protein